MGDGIQPIAKRVDALRKLKSPQNNRDVMKVLESLGFNCCHIKNLHVDNQPFYDLIKNSTPFHWTEKHETLFDSIKERIHKDTVLVVPSTDYSFHIHVESSNIGTGCNLIQQFPEGKRIISFNSRVFDKAEQKISTLHRELCGIVSALQTYEHYIIGSPFPIYLYCDHKPILYWSGRKGQLSHRFFRYQVIITKIQNLRIIWTPGSNYASQIFSAEISRSKNIRCTSCNINVFRVILSFSMRRELQSQIKFSLKTTLTILAPTFTQSGTNAATTKKYYDYKMMERTLPSVVYLTNFQLPQFYKHLTVSEWDDVLTNLDKYMDGKLNQIYQLTHPILIIVQLTP